MDAKRFFNQQPTNKEKKMIRHYSHIPGNYGGETLREYCGLSRKRERYYNGLRIASTGITAQRLVIAIRRHTAQLKGSVK